MKEVTVQSLGLDRSSNTPVVILQEKDGTRVLPIWIGPGEASAIAMELAGMNFSRPLTHDLMASAIRGLGGDLKRVVITKVVENTYYAEMIVTRNGEFFSLDARPSDSIAMALRMDARIFTSEDLLEHTSIEISEPSEFQDEEPIDLESAEEEGPAGNRPPEDLREYLRRLHPEDFGRFTP
jgi:bifunctional DNase/RNase